MVGVDRPEDRHRVERMVGLYGLQGIMASDLRGKRIRPQLSARRPHSLIDRNGILRNKTWGGKTPNYFAENVVPLLREPGP